MNAMDLFKRVQQGDSYAGIIKGDSLILSIPENLCLYTENLPVIVTIKHG